MGAPKAALRLPDGRTLLERTLGLARQVVRHPDDVVALGRLDHPPTAAGMTPLTALPDALPNAGPLAGLCTLLERAADRWAILLSCDMPLLELPLLRRLHGAVADDVDAVVFVRRDNPRIYHACCGMYHPRSLPAARNELEHGKRSLQRVLAAVRVRTLWPSADERRQLTNVNTPEEFRRAIASKPAPPAQSSGTT